MLIVAIAWCGACGAHTPAPPTSLPPDDVAVAEAAHWIEARAALATPSTPAQIDAVRDEVDRLMALEPEAYRGGEQGEAMRRLVTLGRPAMDLLLSRVGRNETRKRGDPDLVVGWLGDTAVCALLDLLKSEDRRVRDCANDALRWCTPQWRASPLGPEICAALAESPKANQRALSAGRPAVRTVAALLGDRVLKDSEFVSCEILVAIGFDAAPAVPAALECMRSGDDHRVEKGMRILNAVGDAAPETIAPLCELLRTPEANRRVAAATLLKRWGERAAAAAPALAEMLGDERTGTSAASALVRMPQAAVPFRRALLDAFVKNEDWNWGPLGYVAVTARETAPSFERECVEAARGFPADRIYLSRRANALGGLWRAGVDLSSAVEWMSADENPKIREIAEHVRRGEKAADVAAKALDALKSNEPASSDSKASPVPLPAPANIDPLLDAPDLAPDGLDWKAVGERLAAKQLDANEAARLVRALSRTERPEVLVALLPAVERLGPRAVSAVPTLRAILYEQFGRGAAFLGGHLDVPLYINTLGNFLNGTSPPDHRPATVRVLAAIGPPARDALPELRDWITRSGDPEGIGADAVRRIEGTR